MGRGTSPEHFLPSQQELSGECETFQARGSRGGVGLLVQRYGWARLPGGRAAKLTSENR